MRDFPTGMLVFAIFILGTAIIPLAASAQTHPSLLFQNIADTPGYRNRAVSPWSDWEKAVMTDANASLGRDFTKSLGSYNRECYRAGYASNLGLAYQITKQPKYAQKAKEALLAMGTVDSTNTDRAVGLAGYSLTYDWIQPALSTADDMKIRDKLATLADTVYQDLNNHGTWRNVIQFADYQGEAYPAMGIAGCVLSDYTNPSHLLLASGPAEWYRVGTDYLFVNDKLHDTGGRSLLSFGFDESSGKFLNGAYKSYVGDDLIRWFQVYSFFTGRNIFEVYPAAKRAFTAELWDSLPNYYSANYVTLGDTRWTYEEGILNLLDDDTRAQALSYLDKTGAKGILPYSRTFGDVPGSLLYLTYEGYTHDPRHNPPFTSRLDASSVYQVFRGSWATDADWLSLVTFNVDSWSNRDTEHNDQLSVEYYSRGDLLLADAGEDKGVLDAYYGPFEIHHNTIAIEDPRTPFSTASWSGTAARGILKGSYGEVDTKVTVDPVAMLPWAEFLEAKATISKVVGTGQGFSITLSSPIQYTRSILFPGKEYFILIDRLKGTEPWTFRTIFRPSTLSITPTSGENVGNVRGTLNVSGKLVDWLSLPYKSDTDTRLLSNNLSWKVTNPYGKIVALELFTVPASEVMVEKHVGRVAGYDTASDVYSPVVSFRSQPANSLYRVTVLLPRYSTETAKKPTAITVTGQGSAVNVHSSSWDDFVYSGTGISYFGLFKTDARTVYARVTDRPVNFTLIGGTSLLYLGQPLIRTTSSVSYVSGEELRDRILLGTKSSSASAPVSLFQIPGTVTGVTRDGSPFTAWSFSAGNLTLNPGSGEHIFEITTGSRGNRPPVLKPIGNRKVNAGSPLGFTASATDPDGDDLTYSALGLPSGASFNAASGAFSWTPKTTQAGTCTVTFVVSDGSLPDSETVTITVTPVTQAIQASSPAPDGASAPSSGSRIVQDADAADIPAPAAVPEPGDTPAPVATSNQTAYICIGSCEPRT
ncbi:MAG TPA: putative Ig domain-containing protein [Methanomicrobiales archaeon]|nr:putative Ig domain-containing protein [Methanomicrobiales archaeon]